jgi:hypothetical protein
METSAVRRLELLEACLGRQHATSLQRQRGAAAAAGGTPPAAALKLLSVERLWPTQFSAGNEQHFFTDLIRVNGSFVCAFREAESHVSEDGVLVIVRSATGQSDWQRVATISCPPPNTDLRDPKLSITPSNELMLTASTTDRSKGLESTVRSYVWASADSGCSWSEAVGPIAPAGEWAWRTMWQDGVAYTFARCEAHQHTDFSKEKTFFQMYRSVDGGKEWSPHGPRQFEGTYANGQPFSIRTLCSPLGLVVALLAGSSHGSSVVASCVSAAAIAVQALAAADIDCCFLAEYDAVFLDDATCKLLVRTNSGGSTARLGTASPPYTDWTWQDTGVQVSQALPFNDSSYHLSPPPPLLVACFSMMRWLSVHVPRRLDLTQ